MRSIHTRAYTNVALTVLIIFLGLLAIRPYVSAPTAQAQSLPDYTIRNEEQRAKVTALNPNADNATATREVAKANKEIAEALREAAKAQKDIAQAIAKLSAQTQ